MSVHIIYIPVFMCFLLELEITGNKGKQQFVAAAETLPRNQSWNLYWLQFVESRYN